MSITGASSHPHIEALWLASVPPKPCLNKTLQVLISQGTLREQGYALQRAECQGQWFRGWFGYLLLIGRQ